MIKYLFIVKNPSFDPSRHQARFVTDIFDASFVAVPSVEEACAQAAEYAGRGLNMIDLCSGFDHDSARRVSDAAGENVAVCYAGLKI